MTCTAHHNKYDTTNHPVGGPVVRAWDQEVCSPVVSSSSLVIANMMTTEGLYGR